MTRIDVSVEEYLAGDSPRDSELIDGEVIVNDPTFHHQEIASRIYDEIREWIRRAGGDGRLGWGGNWVLAPGNVYKPDVWWSETPPDPGGRSDTPPTLAVDVYSPGTWYLDRGRKRDVYEQGGVPELWLVDTPRARVLVSRRSRPEIPTFDVSIECAHDDVLTTPLLDGFSLPLHGLFDYS